MKVFITVILKAEEFEDASVHTHKTAALLATTKAKLAIGKKARTKVFTRYLDRGHLPEEKTPSIEEIEKGMSLSDLGEMTD